MRKRILKWVTRISLAAGLVLVLGTAFLATGPGQRTALKLVQVAASSADNGIRFGRLDGGLFSEGRIDRIAVLDRDGAWLEVRGLAFSWRPFALLGGRLHIEALTADAIDVMRKPAPAEASASGGSSKPPLMRLVLSRFEIGEVSVHEAVAGEPVRLHIEAEAHLVDPAKGLGARVEMRRLDGPGGTLTARLAYRAATGDLDLTVAASEPGDGIVARLLDLGGATLDLAVDGSGPIDAWRATWSLAASGAPFVAGSAAIDRSETGHEIAARFEGYLTPLVPHTAAPLLAGKTAGSFAGHWSDGRLDVAHAALASEALDLRAVGGLDIASGHAFGDVTARIGRADGEPLAFADLTLAATEIRLAAPDTAGARRVTAEASAAGIAHGTRTLDRITLAAAAVQPQTTAWRFEDIDILIGARGLRTDPTDNPADHDLKLSGTASPDRLALAFAMDGLTGTLDGTIAPDALALDIAARLADLAPLVPAMTGTARLEGRLRGALQDLEASLSLTGEHITLHGHPIENPLATLAGRGSAEVFSATFDARAALAGQPLTAQGRIASADSTHALEGLAVTLGAMRVTGDLQIGEGPPTGLLAVDAPSLAALGALISQPLDGALKGEVALSDSPDEPALTFRADSEAIRLGETRLRGLSASGRFDELAEAVRGEAELSVAGVSGGLDAEGLRLTARGLGETVGFTLTGRANGASVELGGMVGEADKGVAITLDKATLRKGDLAAALDAPARIVVADGAAEIGKLALNIGSGRVEVGGTAGADKLDLAARIANLPAGLADAVAPGLGLGGIIEGRVDISGTPESPRADARATWRNAAAHATRGHLPPLTVEANARLAGKRVESEIEAKGPDGLSVAARGALDLSPGGPLKATVTGDIPLALANAALADRATRLAGRAALSADVRGTLAAPSVAGTVRIADATVRDPKSGLAFKPVAAHVRITERGAVIERLEAESERGGTLSGTGELALGEAGAPPRLRLALDIARLRFDDRRLMAGELDGRVEIRGTPDDIAASGAVRLARLDVTVPNAMPRSISELDIRHVNAPPHLQVEAEADARHADEAAAQRVALDIRLDAANRIFVQGRGLDVQLGGALSLGGTAAHPVANGAFTMERGRLAILGRQLDFRRGRIHFYGSLEPLLDMEAAGPAGDVTVIVTVTGSTSDPRFAFSSVPALPEDEVVARLLYNRELAGLSPLQLAQLASEIDKIGGLSSGPGMLDQLKASVGIDVLDIGTDSEGAATVSAGSYVSESTYVGVRQGTAAGSSQVVIDHDLTKNLKARGELGADGKSKIGIGFEWDY